MINQLKNAQAYLKHLRDIIISRRVSSPGNQPATDYHNAQDCVEWVNCEKLIQTAVSVYKLRHLLVAHFYE